MDYIVKTPVTDRKDANKTHWRTVGAGFAKEGGMISIQLDSLPINGKIMLFEPKAGEASDDSKA